LFVVATGAAALVAGVLFATKDLAADAPVLDDRPGPPAVVSPEVAPDRTVVFRLFAPKAAEVALVEGWSGRVHPLTRDDRGVWAATLGPYAPEVYSYQFRVDGVPTPDPSNGRVEVGRNSIQNLFEVSGGPAKAFDRRPVPHGTLHVQRYESKALGGASRELVVYTPPGYEARFRRRYPVLYLLHGTGEDENTWTGVGFAHRIFDNLIADGAAVPMIVVMPDGHAADWHASGDPTLNTKAFEADLLGDVIPLVERSFRTAPGAANRAIAGLSMGGGQAFAVGVAHPDTFAHVCPFSMGRGNAAALAEQLDPGQINAKVKLLWIGCGRQDHLHEYSQGVCQVLAERGICHTWHQTDGEHNWLVWRKLLAEVAPLLFR